MYINRLQDWTKKDWREFTLWLELWESESLKMIQTLTLPKKEWIEANFDTLKALGVINWIWPSYLRSSTIYLISKFFKGVRYEWHDIEYGIGWSEEDRKKADKGLLKYSKKTIKDNIRKAKEVEFGLIGNFLFLSGTYLATALQYWFVYFCYLAVVAFWRFAFRYTID